MIVIGILFSLAGALAGAYILFAALGNDDTGILTTWLVFLVGYFIGYVIVRVKAKDNVVSRIYGILLLLFGAFAGLMLASLYMLPLFHSEMFLTIWTMFLLCTIAGVFINRAGSR